MKFVNVYLFKKYFNNYILRQFFHKCIVSITMFIKYPISQDYKVQQSQIRYKYLYNKNIQNKAKQYLKAYKHLNVLYVLKSDHAIDGLDYFINILRKLDQKSKEINGWTSCFLIINIISEILKGLKQKYGYFSKSIEFANIEYIYQLSNAKNKKITPINNIIFGVLIAIQQHSKSTEFNELQQILECIAQYEMIYLIANYKSRGNRTYQLPWERIDNPVFEFRKKYFRTRENRIKNRKKVNLDSKQSKINHFFQRMNHSSILDSDDDEILDLLEYLDNEK